MAGEASGMTSRIHSPRTVVPGPVRRNGVSFGPERAVAMSAKRASKPPRKSERPRRGRARLSKLRAITEQEIQRSSPPELADLPADFFDDASLVRPDGEQST